MTQPQYPFRYVPEHNDRDEQPYDPSYSYGHGYPYDQSPSAGQQYPAGTWTPPAQAYGYGGYAYAAPAPVAPRTNRRRTASLAAVAAAALAAVIGVAAATGAHTSVSGTGVAAQQAPVNPNNGGSATIPGTLPNGGTPNGSGNSGTSGSGNASTSVGQATSAQQVGVVDIYTKLKYQQAAAAGTGLVVDSDGYVLTNNHVIDGSTTIKVVVVATGKTYSGTVVGDAPTQDIAVLKLANASGMQVANLGDSNSVKVGDAITGVGNAGGSGGTPSAAAGTVQSLNQTITASDESGTNSEQLTGVIVTNAPIQAGDSGGPLYNKANEVVGIDTAASTSGQSAGFAIPINKALAVAKQIRSGVETSVIHIGYPAFLGVGVQNATTRQGALITNVEPGLPAAKAGIVAGDVITGLNGSAVTSANSLRAIIGKINPGQTVAITYVDTSGTSHRTTSTLTTGPAD